MLLTSPLVSLAGAALTLAMVGGAAMAADALGPYRWTSRVLLVSAPNGDAPDVERQRQLFQSMGRQAAERDLVLVEALGQGARARELRLAADIGSEHFVAVLIGKDGGVKVRSNLPLAADGLFPVIDAMPMRRDEMRKREP